MSINPLFFHLLLFLIAPHLKLKLLLPIYIEDVKYSIFEIQFLRFISNFICKGVGPPFYLKFVLARIKFPKKIEPFSLYQKKFYIMGKKRL
jgi:hypothetical protein